MSLATPSAPEAPQVSDFTPAAHRAAFQNLSAAYSPDAWGEGCVPDFTPAAHREAFLSNAYSPPDMRSIQQRPDYLPPIERVFFQMEEVRRHTSRDDAWIVVHGNVYDITNFIKNHPGWGVGPQTSTVLAIMRTLGTDCTVEFDMIHKKYAIRQLADYRIGELHTAICSTADDNVVNNESTADSLKLSLHKQQQVDARSSLQAAVRLLGKRIYLPVHVPITGALIASCVQAYHRRRLENQPSRHVNLHISIALAVAAWLWGALNRPLLED